MVLEGAMTALVTPLRDGGVDRDALSRLVDEQIAAGIDALVAVGTTGESATLSAAEQAAVIEHVVRRADGRVPVVAGAGANATATAIERSKAAADAGAQALLHVTPYYNKPTQEGLYRHFTAIAEATSLPVVLYNVPARTSVDLFPDTVIRLADHPRIVAIKEATGDLRRAAELVRVLGERMAVLSGDDFTAFPLFAVGGRGVISVVSNAAPDRVAAMWDAAAAGDYERARRLHLDLLPLVELLFVEPNPIPLKAALELMGRIGPEIRPPLTPASERLRARLADELRRQGLV